MRNGDDFVLAFFVFVFFFFPLNLLKTDLQMRENGYKLSLECRFKITCLISSFVFAPGVKRHIYV